MLSNRCVVSTVAELLSATTDSSTKHIIVAGDISDVPTLHLLPGQTLSSLDEPASLRFKVGMDGVRLCTNNALRKLKLRTDPDKRAVFNDTDAETLGRLVLESLSISGVVQLLARGRVRAGSIEAHCIDILMADARGFVDRPAGFGVEVIQGAFTLWNQQSDPAVTIFADMTGISAGRVGAPVQGSGIFASGNGSAGGRLVVHRIEAGPVFCHGGIQQGTADRISAGVFAGSGAHVDRVVNEGPTTTYGPNDMVLDNWGTVDHWVVREKVTSYGPSGIGFVNFGTIEALQVGAVIETFGQGARGFNVYDGTVHSAEFDRIVTHADGAVGVQISQPVGDISVRRGVETFGGTGDSLVKGVVVKLSATAVSIKPGGSARALKIGGGVRSHGEGIDPLELRGRIGSLKIDDTIATQSGMRL